MKQSTLPIIVIIITAVVALLVFLSYDHSGLSVTDCSFKEDTSQPGTYNMTYTLLVGRHFNLLECNYTLYTQDNEKIREGSTQLKEVYTGSFPITDIITLNDTGLNVTHADITIFTQMVEEEDGVNKTYMEKSYTRSFDL